MDKLKEVDKAILKINNDLDKVLDILGIKLNWNSNIYTQIRGKATILVKNYYKIRRLQKLKNTTTKSVYSDYPYKSQKGKYIQLYSEDHKIIISEHRYLMELSLGKKLKSNEIVHHIDENPLNNDINNLIIMTPSDHIRLHKENNATKLD